MKIISFSLYNDFERYNYNAILNCIFAKNIYPDWICRFHIDDSTNKNIIEILKKFDNVQIVKMNNNKEQEGMLWRFMIDDADIFISRDCDSWLSYREKSLVDEFEKSDKQFHLIYDHCYYTHKIYGGLFGMKKGLIDIKNKAINYNGKNDMDFLLTEIYPLIKNNALIHKNIDNNCEEYEDIINLNKFECYKCFTYHKFFIGMRILNISEYYKKIILSFLL